MDGAMKLGCYVEDRWVRAVEEGVVLRSAVNGEPVATASSAGIDFGGMAAHARRVGGPKLRAMTFHERALMLKALAQYLNERKQEFYALSTQTGATKKDSWIDIDGGISTMFVYSSKGRRELPDDHVLCDGPPETISRGGTFVGQHVYLPLRGVALHINAFNFPCWGMLEKLAPTLLAGVPAIVKPATSTAYLAERVFRRMIDSGLLPEGAIQLLCGGIGDLFDHLDCQDVVAFTGSKSTADRLRQHPNLVARSVRFGAETDSLNCSVLGPDAKPGSPEFDLYCTEIVNEMSSKAGQKCTAIRRIIAPSKLSGALTAELAQRLGQIRIGNPAREDVDMGALVSLDQKQEVADRVRELERESRILYRRGEAFEVTDADVRKGAFFSPVLLLCDDPMKARAPHTVEAFGPVATVLPYESIEEAAALARMGEGSLAASIFTHDDGFAREIVLESGPFHGRMLVINRDCAKESTGHGSPLPHLVHGGPGRAGGGEELGGIRGVKHYMQRTALQGSPETLTTITRKWIRGAKQRDPGVHPFRKSFDELTIGDTIRTAERTVTLEDIGRFAELSGDHFYAHTDPEAAARNPFFEGLVAHGYFVVSAAAGLFVHAPFGPVLANYGLDDLRFAKPVKPGDRLKARLTCKQKTRRAGTGYGEVRWDTEVTNQNGETVAAYDVLTMVATQALFAGLATDPQ